MSPTQELYEVLRIAYQHFNEELFQSGLPEVIFTVQRKPGVQGFFAAERWGDEKGNKCSEIAINPVYLASSRLIEVMQTLVHEMVHCWQHHFGRASRPGYHNMEWARKMIAAGLMPSRTGQPGGEVTGQSMADYILEDGQFMASYNRLISNRAFSLKWVDRRALPRLSEPVIVSPNTVSPKGLALADKIVESQEVCSIKLEPAAINSDEATLSELLPDSFWLQANSRKSTRKKYVCPGCNAKVYGRPGLALRCDDCNELFH